MFRSLCALIAISVGVALSPSAAQGWKELRLEDAGYSIEMPAGWKAGFQEMPTKSGPIKVYGASAEAGPVTYITTYANSSGPIDGAMDIHEFFNSARNGAVASAKGKLRSEREVTISGHLGREIIIDSGTGGVMIMRMFLYGNTLIQAIVGGPPGTESHPDARRFLDSLRILERRKV